MPSPTSMTVPTSVTASFCSNPAISCFKTLVISATFIAIASLRLIFSIHVSTFNVSSRSSREHLPFHRLKLILHARIDQLIIHPQHHPPDDFLIHILMHNRILLQRLTDPLPYLLQRRRIQ